MKSSIAHLSTLLVFLLASLTLAYDVPLEKADPPLMEPRLQTPKITHRVFITFMVDGGKKPGTIELGLFGEVAPKAVENFLALIRCDRGVGAITGKSLCYKGSTLHRIIPNFLIQGGDFTHGDGRGGETIYNGELFEDESFEVPLNRPYVLVNSNKGQPNSNGSQFFITAAKTQWLQGKYVGFGKVLKGEKVVTEIEKYGSSTGEVSKDVRILDCGEVDLLPEDKDVTYW